MPTSNISFKSRMLVLTKHHDGFVAIELNQLNSLKNILQFKSLLYAAFEITKRSLKDIIVSYTAVSPSILVLTT